jgi:hypothetical protein
MKTREELQAALDDLRRERGSATLAGRAFDSDQIAAIQAQLDAIQDAEAEAARRQRAENEGAHSAELTAKRAELRGLIEEDLMDTADMQEAANLLIGCFRRKLERIQVMARLAYDITGKPAPVCLSRPELERRLGYRLSAVMHSGLPLPNKARLGPLAFSPGVEKADVKWWEVDAATFAKHLNPIIGEETNGKS